MYAKLLWACCANVLVMAREKSVSDYSTPAPSSPLDFLARNFVRQAPRIRQAAAETNVFNPVPSITRAVGEGRLPSRGEVGTDAAFAAIGFLPTGKAASRLASIVNRLNRSTDVGDFITPQTMRYAERPNDANEGLYRPGAQSFDYDNVPEPATPYTFGLVQTEKLAPLREFDRAAEEAGQQVFGPDNIKKLAEHMAEGGKWTDPAAVVWDPGFNWAYLGEGNHRLALAQALGLEQMPATVWRSPGAKKSFVDKMLYGDQYRLAPSQRTQLDFAPDYNKLNPPIGRRMEIDTNQLRRDQFGDFPRTVGDYYVPPTMNPYLFRYLRPE